ncbi:MAG: type II toxin-antitoxin system MqsA family antitoxin [Coriobacteriales bacterium]|nr:type II toxin-antitoxin system MqsA family antitoxin [Coriobacteriales bacterium]
MMKCASCGGTFVPSNEPIEFEVRGEVFLIDGVEHLECSTCSEVILDASVGSILQAKANHEYRKTHGYLTGSEIRTIRKGLGLTQEAFEDLLGLGHKTIVRWEKETVVQNRTADKLMRILRDNPEILNTDAFHQASNTGAVTSVSSSNGLIMAPALSL